jgi:tetratricopeptide (TPR) repeat protein
LVAAASVAALRLGHADAGQRQRVEDWLTAVSEKQPRSPLLRILLAELHERSGRYEAAREDYRGILKEDPHHLLALNNLAYSLALHAGKPAEALKCINAAIDQAGPAPELLDTRAVIYLRSRQARPAMNDLRLALVQEPTAAKYFHLAQAQRLAGALNDAALAFRQAGALGLTARQLPPVEQAAFEQLAGDLTPATVPRR